MGERYEAIVIGSGFGGAITCCRLAKKWPGKVAVLERGKRYPMGSFPRSPHDISRNFWNVPEEKQAHPRITRSATGQRGLFDVRSYRRMNVVMPAALGGGSLIYSNVFLLPRHRYDSVSVPVRLFRRGTRALARRRYSRGGKLVRRARRRSRRRDQGRRGDRRQICQLGCRDESRTHFHFSSGYRHTSRGYRRHHPDYPRGAVFFTMFLVVVNAMALSVRERTGELALLKAVGFTDGKVLALVLTEAVGITAIGGLLGLGLGIKLCSLYWRSRSSQNPRCGLTSPNVSAGSSHPYARAMK